jgi:hypothetical protein
VEHREGQTQAFAEMLEFAQIPLAERPQVMRGVDLFFSRGWPSNHFTVGMAARAGKGLIPPVYGRQRRALFSIYENPESDLSAHHHAPLSYNQF